MPMIERIRQFFKNNMDPDQHSSTSVPPVQMATAALLLEVMLSDGQSEPDELQSIRQVLIDQFGIPESLLTELISLASEEVEQATSLYQFTAEVNRYFRRHQKLELVTSLWRVALADGRLDKYEEGLIRKIAELIHLSHSDFILAKHNAC